MFQERLIKTTGAAEKGRKRDARRGVKLRHFYPLLGFLIPTLVIGYGVVIPRSCIAGWNEQSIGFATALLGACLAYWQGIRWALRGCSDEGENHAPS